MIALTKRGFEVELMARQTIWRHDNEITVSDDQVRKGDLLPIKLGWSNHVAEFPELPRLQDHIDVRAERHRIPTRLDEPMAEFLGLMVADGCIFSGGYRLAKRHQSVVDRFIELNQLLFGVTPRSIAIGETPGGEVHSAQITAWLRQLGGLNPHSKAVPAAVFAASLRVQAAFMRGLFEDGTVNRRKNGNVDHIHFDNVDPVVTRAVQMMLLDQGIIASRANRRYVSTLYIYSDHISTFAQKVGFVAPEKMALIVGADVGHDVRTRIPMTRSEVQEIRPWLSVTDRQNALVRGGISRRVAQQVVADSGGTAQTVASRLQWLHEPVVGLDVSYDNRKRNNARKAS